jgi:hypothetical protein
VFTTARVLAVPTSNAPPSTVYPKNAETEAIKKPKTTHFINE